MQHSKGMSVLSYLGLLILIPFFMARDDALVRYHINQGLVLFIADIILSIVAGVIIYVPVVGELISAVIGIVPFVLMIIGIVHAVKCEMKPLPLIGGIQIIR